MRTSPKNRQQLINPVNRYVMDMYCKNCGANIGDSPFCYRCGARQDVRVPQMTVTDTHPWDSTAKTSEMAGMKTEIPFQDEVPRLRFICGWLSYGSTDWVMFIDGRYRGDFSPTKDHSRKFLFKIREFDLSFGLHTIVLEPKYNKTVRTYRFEVDLTGKTTLFFHEYHNAWGIMWPLTKYGNEGCYISITSSKPLKNIMLDTLPYLTYVCDGRYYTVVPGGDHVLKAGKRTMQVTIEDGLEIDVDD